MTRALLFAASVAGLVLVATLTFVLALRAAAWRRRKRFFEELGKVVRIGTPCRFVRGRALLPGSVALTPAGIVWDTVAGGRGSLTFEEVRRLETDDALSSGRRFLRAKVLRVTPSSGESYEFVVSPGHAWEWRKALGEWTAARAALGRSA